MHPMEPDHYIKSIQIMNFTDPVVIKGKFYFTPVNGEVYLGTQIRLAGGESEVWVVAEFGRQVLYWDDVEREFGRGQRVAASWIESFGPVGERLTWALKRFFPRGGEDQQRSHKGS